MISKNVIGIYEGGGGRIATGGGLFAGSVPMFPGTHVPQYLCSPVPMFPGFCNLIVVISIDRLQILTTPWYDSRLWLCLGFRFRVLVRVRLELQRVFRLLLKYKNRGTSVPGNIGTGEHRFGEHSADPFSPVGYSPLG